MRRVCPACGRRWSGWVDPDCPVCAGAGYLVLGAAGLARHGHEVTARAVEYALEGAARNALGLGLGVAAGRAALTAAVGKLVHAGLLGLDEQPAADRRRLLTTAGAHFHAARATRGYTAGDAALLDTSALDWAPDDRPLSGAATPGFSLGFHLCSLARVADRFDPMRTSVRDIASGRYVAAKMADRVARTLPLFDLERTAR